MPHGEISAGSCARPDRRRPDWVFGNAMGLPGWMRIIAVLLCIVGGIMLMIESKNKEEASVKQRDGSEH